MTAARYISAVKRFLKDNYFHIGVFSCFLIGLELFRLPVYGATFSLMLTTLPWNYDIPGTLAGLAVVIADALLLALPALFVRKRKWIIFVWILLFDIFCLVQRLYAAVYMDLMPFSHFALVRNVNTTLLDSAEGLFSLKEVLVFIPLAVLIFVDRRLKGEKKYGRRPLLASIVVALAGYGAAAVYNINAVVNESYSIFQPYTTVYKTRGYVCDNGLIPYAVFSAIDALVPYKLSEKDKTELYDFLNASPKYADNRFAPKERKNVIIIVVESMNSWLLNREVNGVEVMPTLDSLLRREGTVAALKVFPQVKDGRSSDGHFIIGTGLLPLSAGSVATSHCKPYGSLARALKSKGYRSFNMVCDDCAAWNQGEMSAALGFDTIYDCSISERHTDRITDGEMLGNALTVMKKMPQPFLAQLVTIDTHQPGYKTDKPTALSKYPTDNKVVINALENFHTLDTQLGHFLKDLKDNGLFDNSIIVIVSDHNDVDFNKFENRPAVEGDNYCAFIAINTGVTKTVDGVCGQVDIYPTISDLVGTNDYSWKGLGYSLLRYNPDVATYCDGTVAGNTKSPYLSRCRDAWRISEFIVKSGDPWL